ncbi:MAG: hypothetical protein J1F35_06945 [Erysipelotrichales bacterium]|nr:hypothetical protein [Erysipelotrichales bacterium]
MKKNGFTLVEVLAILIVLGFLVALTIPAYLTVLKSVKRDNYQSKVREIEVAAKKYGESVKDDVKSVGNACYRITVERLIQLGELTSDDDKEDVIYNATDNTPLLGEIRVCYDEKNFDIEAYYTVEFDSSSLYHKGDKVTIGNTIYECLHDYTGEKSGGIEGSYKEDNKTLSYFKELWN